MRSMRALLVVGAALAVASMLACGKTENGPTTTPTNPPTTTPPVTLPGPGACSPTPPPLMDILLEVQSSDGYTQTIKATPRVPNTDGYCDRVGYGAYKFCNVRRPDDPQKAACESLAVGQATDTGRWGPTWQYNLHYEANHLCTGADPGCTNHASNQFLLIEKGAGSFYACASPSVPLSTDPLYAGSRCTRCKVDSNGDQNCS